MFILNYRQLDSTYILIVTNASPLFRKNMYLDIFFYMIMHPKKLLYKILTRAFNPKRMVKNILEQNYKQKQSI